MHYEVEARTVADDWLRRRKRHELFAVAWVEAERVSATGGVARIVQVPHNRTRKLVE